MLRYNRWPTRRAATQQDLMIKSQLLKISYKYSIVLMLNEYLVHGHIRIFIHSIIYQNSNYIILLYILRTKNLEIGSDSRKSTETFGSDKF